MPITIGSNVLSLRVQRQIGRTSDELSSVFQNLSSGQRINKASDDSAGLSIAMSLQAKRRIYTQGIRNLNDGISGLAIADNSLESLTGIVVRQQELAEQAANGTYSSTQLKALDEEAQSLSKEFTRIVSTTKFNGLSLLSNIESGIRLQCGNGEDGSILATLGGAVGDGTFTMQAQITAGTNPRGIKAADLNGDGMVDMVTTDYSSGKLSVFLNNGDGNFTRSSQITITGNNPHSVVLKDFNNDGVIDIANTNYWSANMSISLGKGDGSFSTATNIGTGGRPEGLCAADLNGDGNLDIATANWDGGISIMLGRGDGSFYENSRPAIGSMPGDVVAADLNGDGVLDLVGTNQGDGNVSVLLGNGDGTFKAQTTYGIGGNANRVTAGDFNGDGKIDLAADNSTLNRISVIYGDGRGAFGGLKSFSVTNSPTSITSGDFNSDGILDIATAGSSGMSTLIGKGDGTFNEAKTLQGVSTSEDLVATDFNGDGVLDIAVANHGASSVTLYAANTKSGVSFLQQFSLETMADARQALPMFKRKIDQLASQRGQIGASQARIDVAKSVLGVSNDNFASAESRIMDCDIAEKSALMTRLSIIQQVSSSVLAQANQQPSIALQLLQ